MSKQIHKIHAVHNGIPVLSDNFRHKNQNHLEMNLIMVARFSPQKNQQMLIEAVHELICTGVQLHLTLVGDGSKYDEIKAYVARVEIGEYITFLGSRTDISEILATQDVFVLISQWEGFPITILEAMRQGLPVVASDVGGVSEAVEDHKIGFLIPRDDKEYLKEKLKILYFNRELCEIYGQNAEHRFRENFTSDQMMEKILSVYDEILKENGQTNQKITHHPSSQGKTAHQ